MLDMLTEQILPVLGPAVLTTLGILIVFSISLIIKVLSDKIKLQVVHEALRIVEEITANAVNASIEKAKEAYKERMEDGKLTKRELIEIRDIAIDRALEELPNLIQKLISLTGTELQVLIEDLTETYLKEYIKEDNFLEY